MLLPPLLLALPVLQEPDPDLVSASRLQDTLETLCREPRLAGSPASRLAANYAATVFEAFGFRVERAPFEAWLPRQTGARLELLAPDGRRELLPLEEKGLARDPWSRRGHQPPMHGLTGAGRAEGRVVFAGRGTREEFAHLRELLGPELRGTIALIRYGGLYRGEKVRNAEEAGCAGALLYSDAEDDGAGRGPVLPEGPWRPDSGIQRGSVFNGDGEALTPGWPAVAGARRLRPEEAPGLVHIPSLPVSWAVARRLFGPDGRPETPRRLPVRVALEVEQERKLVPIENVLGWLEGGSHPDEWIVFGGHRDAWGFGAVDNGSGTAVLLELARILGTAARRGWRPDRSIVIATWDAEEWGLVGSTEWVELHRRELLGRGVAYVNLDAVVSGSSFGASSTPGLVEVLRQAAALEDLELPETLGTPGGGSDHVPFLELAGMEVLGFGFHGGNGVYHSVLDTPWVMETHLDPGYRNHERAARLAVRLAVLLSRAGTRVDGIAGWAERIRGAAEGLDPGWGPGRDEVLAAAEALSRAAREGSSFSHPHRFLRFFVPAEEGGRLRLWQSSGYGGLWFPEAARLHRAGSDPGEALDRVARNLRLVAAILTSKAEAAAGD